MTEPKKRVPRAKPGLPPVVAGFTDDGVTWQRIEAIDYDMLGYVLSCHLIIEHYMDNALVTLPFCDLDWEAARLTFGQKVALFSGVKFVEPYNLPPVIKHLNSLRNRFGHDISARLTPEDMLPFRQFLEKCTKSKEKKKVRLPTKSKDVLHLFTSIACSYLASTISWQSKMKRASKRIPNPPPEIANS